MENIQKLDLQINIAGPIIGSNIVYRYNINTNPKSYNSSLFVPTNYSLEEAMKNKRLTSEQQQEIFTDKKKLEEFSTKVNASEKSNISKVIEGNNAIYIIKTLFNTDIKGKAIFYVKNHKFIVENNVENKDITYANPKFLKNTKVTTTKTVDINNITIPQNSDYYIVSDNDPVDLNVKIRSHSEKPEIYVVPGSSLKISITNRSELENLAIANKQSEIKRKIESPYEALNNKSEYMKYIKQMANSTLNKFMLPENEVARNNYINNFIAKYNGQFNIKKNVKLTLKPDIKLLNHLAKQKNKDGNSIFNIDPGFNFINFGYDHFIKNYNCSTQKSRIHKTINSLCAKEKQEKQEKQKKLATGGTKRKITKRKITKRRKKGGTKKTKTQRLGDNYRKYIGYPLTDLSLCSLTTTTPPDRLRPNITSYDQAQYF